MMELWNDRGMMERLKYGVSEWLDDEIMQWWNIGMIGIIEWCNDRMME